MIHFILYPGYRRIVIEEYIISYIKNYKCIFSSYSKFDEEEIIKNIMENDVIILIIFYTRERKCMKLFNDLFNKNNIKFYILNLEQLSWNTSLNIILKTEKILDYSEENMNIIKNKEVYHLPYLVNRKEIYSNKKNGVAAIDGYRGLRRIKIYKILKERLGDNFNLITNKFGEERDNLLFTNKILLNIHSTPQYFINEQIRVNRCVFNKMIVISEPGYNDDLLYLKKYIIFCDYDKIPEKVEEVLNNYEKYYNELFKDFDLDEIEKHYKTIADETIKKIDNN